MSDAGSLVPAIVADRKWPNRLAIVLVHLGLLLLWQAVVVGFGIRAFILPSPLAMLHTLGAPTYAWGPTPW